MDISFDEIKQIIAETSRRNEEAAARNEETAALYQAHTLHMAQLEQKFATEQKLLERKLAAEKIEFERKLAAEKAEREERFAIEKVEFERKLAAEKAEREERFAAEKAERDANLARERADLERTIKQTNNQLGELGNKLGTYTEGMAFPTIERIFREEMGMTDVSQRRKIIKNDQILEMDVFGYANGTTNQAIVAEVKSNLHPEDLQQLEAICQKVADFIPEHRGKKINGMLVFVSADDHVIRLAQKRGFYAVRTSDDNFQMLSPEGFVARDFGKS